MKLNKIDLFAGCGGLTDGFLQTGFYNSLAAVDWELPTINTLRNRLEAKWGYYSTQDSVIHFDIQRTEELIQGFKDDHFGSSVGLDRIIDSPVDLIVGGPPCQAYSIAGRVRDANGMQDDYRNYLFESYVKIVDHFQPQAFVFENVEGILSAQPGGIPIVNRITKAFNDIGYEITDSLKENALFDTSFYNVPQKRKRVIIFGVKIDKNSESKVREFYHRMKLKASAKPMSAKSAFEGLPKICPDNTSKASHSVETNGEPIPFNHEPRKHNERDIEIFRLLAEDIRTGKNQYKSSRSLIDLYKERTGKSSRFHKYHVIREDKPSNTIPAHLYKDGLRHIHPDPAQARTITVREAARLQSFDDDFEFIGSKTDQYKMIGNAVPPQFAKVIAQAVHETIFGEESVDHPAMHEVDYSQA